MFILYIVTLCGYVAIDAVWLSMIMQDFYRHHFSLIGPQVFTLRLVPALLAWALVVGGSLIFVMPLIENSLLRAIIYGAFYGFVLYGVYDFSNYATIQQWSLNLLLADLAWGVVINAFLGMWWWFIKKVGFLI